MAESNKYREICSICKNAPGCTFPKDSQKPVLNCEEFEIEACSPVKTTEKGKLPATASADTEGEDSGKFIGLCRNCDSSRTCAFPKPEGGIWHCEEYK